MKPGVYIQPDGKLIEIFKFDDSTIIYFWDTHHYSKLAYGPFVFLDNPDEWFENIKIKLEYLGPLE